MNSADHVISPLIIFGFSLSLFSLITGSQLRSEPWSQAGSEKPNYTDDHHYQ